MFRERIDESRIGKPFPGKREKINQKKRYMLVGPLPPRLPAPYAIKHQFKQTKESPSRKKRKKTCLIPPIPTLPSTSTVVFLGCRRQGKMNEPLNPHHMHAKQRERNRIYCTDGCLRWERKAETEKQTICAEVGGFLVWNRFHTDVDAVLQEPRCFDKQLPPALPKHLL